MTGYSFDERLRIISVEEIRNRAKLVHSFDDARKYFEIVKTGRTIPSDLNVPLLKSTRTSTSFHKGCQIGRRIADGSITNEEIEDAIERASNDKGAFDALWVAYCFHRGTNTKIPRSLRDWGLAVLSEELERPGGHDKGYSEQHGRNAVICLSIYCLEIEGKSRGEKLPEPMTIHENDDPDKPPDQTIASAAGLAWGLSASSVHEIYERWRSSMPDNLSIPFSHVGSHRSP